MAIPSCSYFVLLAFHFLLLVESSKNPDLDALMVFKAASDTHNKLKTWNSTTDPCTSWTFVSCFKNRVSRLVLENLDLSGSIEPLASLTHLRVLSLKRNRFSGPIPSLSNFTALKLLFLSHNEFSGPFPATVTSLVRLDLSHNNLSGNIPATVNRLSHLLTLRLDQNRFSGHIPVLNLPNLQDFNVSGNRLSGEIPKSLSGFPESSFAQNPTLCGAPLVKCGESRSAGAIASPLKPGSNPPMPRKSANTNTTTTTHHHNNGAPKMSRVTIIAVVLGDVLVLSVMSLLLYCYFWRTYSAKLKEGKGSGSNLLESEKIVYSSSPYPSSQPGSDKGQMVFFEGLKRFELEDLLRASAEMLGKGGFGTAYKAVLEDGNVVAVKRLKDAQINGRKEFEQHMEVLGRLRHLNVVSLRAYYFAREEKLLVYDYMPNGSLFWLLHGNRGPGRTPLDWTTRLKIASGVARGVAFIHTSCKTLKLTHGNIKSTNILIDNDGNACVSDFGLSAFAIPSSSSAAPRSNGYRAPEALDGRKQHTHKSDVYSFGVLLLELLTGKCPSVVDTGGPVDLPRWVQSVVREEWTAEVFDIELMRYKDIEEEMVGLLQIAMSCAAAAPDQRPRMSHVVKMIEEIRGVEVSPCHDTLDSVSESPSFSEDACGASQ